MEILKKEESVGRSMTAEEVYAEILAAFPPDCGPLFFEIYSGVGNLDLNWQHYRSLYGTSPERIALLNWAAGLFFGLLDIMMWHDVILRIARLTDPPKYGRYTRASVGQLVECVSKHVDPEYTQRLTDEKNALEKYCEPIRTIRNRVLAHYDLPTALKYHPDPLPGLSRAYIEGALDRIRNLVNEISSLFNLAPVDPGIILPVGNAETLINLLEKAREKGL